MNKKYNFLLLILIALPILHLGAQDYFQQEVNYNIQAKLDDTQHVLDGKMTVEYTNNAPSSMNEIYFHLWANAYSSKSSPFAEQLLRMKRSKFHYADLSQMGGYDEITFLVNGQEVKWSYEDPSHEIVKLVLNSPLQSGGKAAINISFKLKIPLSFSRLGHIKTSYQMTQWYPKPAVFDKDGWHTMPYLSLGEFYSEFGSFDVSIELPENYIVAATGEMHSKKEAQYLNHKIKESTAFIKNNLDSTNIENSYPKSSKIFKTLRFTADKIHDFAWFADKRFHVQKSEVELESGKVINTWAFFTNDEIKLWDKATDYIDESVAHYSKNVGEYPYSHATAVQSALSAGAGMEYPMITVIGLSREAKTLDNVITHEVGHNWFYGILASNERDHAWMDEGLNTYMETRYMVKKYGPGQSRMLPKFLMNTTDIKERDLLYLVKAAINADQASSTPCCELGMMNYEISAYSKPGKTFRYLEEYLGTDKFDIAMQHYYNTWKFKHPGPKDIKTAFEESTGKNLDWLFDDLLGSKKKMDYAIGRVKTKNGIDVEIVNRGDIASPVLINGMKDGNIMYSEWSDGFTGSKHIHLETEALDEIILDQLQVTLDVNRENNQTDVTGLFKKMNPLNVGFGLGLDHSKKANYYILPSLGYNSHDGFMLGLGLHNIKLPNKNLEFYALPMYGFHSKSLVGLGEIRYSWYPNGFFDRIQIGSTVKRFNYLENKSEDIELAYSRAHNFIDFEFGRSNTGTIVQNLKLSYIALDVEYSLYNLLGEFQNLESSSHPYYKADYTLQNKRTINPYGASINLEYNDYEIANSGNHSKYLKLGASIKGSINYQKKKGIHYRLFAGTFLMNDRRKSGNEWSGRIGRGEFGLSYESYNDNYLFDEYFLGRNQNKGFLSRQVLIKEGGFKNVLTRTYSNQIGQSNDYMTAINLAIDIPKIPLLQAYFDMGYYGEAINQAVEGQLVYSGGLAIKIPYLMNIYFPLFHSKELKEAYTFASKSKWYKQITFSMDLKDLNVDKIARSFLYY